MYLTLIVFAATITFARGGLGGNYIRVTDKLGGYDPNYQQNVPNFPPNYNVDQVSSRQYNPSYSTSPFNNPRLQAPTFYADQSNGPRSNIIPEMYGPIEQRRGSRFLDYPAYIGNKFRVSREGSSNTFRGKLYTPLNPN